LLFVTPHWRHHGKRGAKLLGTWRTLVARWTLTLPTSLAELPNYVSRTSDTPGPRLAAFTRRYVISVTDETEQPLDESDEIAYLRSTPVETVLGNHFFVLLQLAALQLTTIPANLPGAQLVIDAVAAMLQAGGDRLGEHVELYRNALAEVQQLYVRAASAPPPS
jgi:hypothetical protein